LSAEPNRPKKEKMASLPARALACLCLLLVLPLKAQVVGTFPVRRYGTEQGLGSEVVSAMVQDPSGRLWVGTDAGVCVFDGRRFSPFTGPLPSQSVLNLSVDLDGAVWVATEGGLARINQGQSRIFGETEGIPTGRVEEVARDAEGHLWVLTSQGVRVEQATQGFIAPAPWPDKELPTHLFADPSLSGAWAITSRTLWYWKGNSWTRLESPRLAPGEILQNVAVDGDGDLWVRSSNALWRLPAHGPRTWIGSRMSGGFSHISKLSRDTEGWVWLDNTEGLWRLRGHRREQYGHAQDDARGGMVDQEGGLWLRTDKGVLRVLGQTRWRSYGRQDGLPVETCWQMVRDRSGRLWVGTDSGLWVVEGQRFKRVLPGRFLTLTLAKDDTLWASGSPGGTVHVVDTRTLVAKALRIDSLPVARITAGLTIDAEGHPWVADLQGGLVRGTRTSSGWAWETMLIDGSTPREVRSLHALPGGGILLFHDRSASTWQQGTWRRIPDLLPEVPYVAANAPDGRMVIAYRNRPAITVHRLQGGQLLRTAVLDLTASGKQLALYCVAFGSQGRLWIGTNNGLGCLDNDDSRTFRLLGAEDRLISPECNESGILAEPGRIWISTPVGLMSHEPLPDPPSQMLRPPLLISARSGPKELDLFDSAPELSRTKNDLEVQFMVPNYQVQGSLFYAARMSGVDADWTHLDTPVLRYAGLQAGSHVLELRGMTREGVQGPVTSFHFRVRPAWWERWWIRVLGLFGLAGLIALIVKARQAQLETRNRELIDEVARQTSALVEASKAKSAFLANMSHELRTPLNAILLYSEIMQEDMQDPALGGHRSDVGKIHSAGRHLLGLIDDILDMSKIEAGHLQLDLHEIGLRGFLQDLDAFVRPLVEKNGNRYELSLQEIPDHIHSDPTRLRQILVNLLSNSAKFTQQGRVSLTVWSEGEHLILRVEDSGIGMTPEQQARVFEEFVQADESTTRKFGGTGLGLTLVKKFTGLLGGEILLQSVPGKGTTFTLKLPLAGPPPDLASGAHLVMPWPTNPDAGR
jgi:signal transduction histidine kinase/ligand-binding sensor domain-containing protein